jgi:hypothetical protein
MERLAGLSWRKSTYSGSNGGGCVETAAQDDRVIVRDTRDRSGPVLWFGSPTWRRFTDKVKGEQKP